jgi:hypothetical protein
VSYMPASQAVDPLKLAHIASQGARKPQCSVSAQAAPRLRPIPGVEAYDSGPKTQVPPCLAFAFRLLGLAAKERSSYDAPSDLRLRRCG